MTKAAPAFFNVRLWCGVLFVAAVAFYAFVWRHAPLLEGDSAQYMEVARDLSDGRLDALHDRTPGYPVLLAMTGSADSPARGLFYVSLVLHGLSIWMLGAVLRAAGVGRRGLIGFAVIAWLPPYVEPAAQVMTENLAEFLLASGVAGLAVWLRERRQVWLIASAGAFACCGLTKPVYQVLPLWLAGLLIIWAACAPWAGVALTSARRAATVLVLGMLVIVGGFALWNGMRFGVFAVTPATGFHFSTKTMSFVERLPDEYAPVRDRLVRERDRLLVQPGGNHTGTQAIWGVRDELMAVTGLSKSDLSSYLVRMNLALIARAPMEYLQEVLRSLTTYWLPAGGPLVTGISPLGRWPWILIHVAVVGGFLMQVIVILGATMYDASRVRVLAQSWRIPRYLADEGGALTVWIIAAAVIAYTMALVCLIDIGEVRQRRQTDLLLIFGCVLGANIWWSSLRNGPPS